MNTKGYTDKYYIVKLIVFYFGMLKIHDKIRFNNYIILNINKDCDSYTYT